jgi:molybdopterin/thiamine biosynthesis adenylyltransferase
VLHEQDRQPDQPSSFDPRYARQAILPGFGAQGQSRLARAHAMIVGVGALGCPAADLLVRAGVGRVTLIDRDVVELSNLHRQTLFDEADAGVVNGARETDQGQAQRGGLPKADAAARRLRAVNSRVRVEPIVEDFDASNAERLVRPHPRPDVILDCTDNFQTRYLLNDVCVKLGIPLVYAGAIATRGMAMTIVPARAQAPVDGSAVGPPSACLRCVFPEPPEDAQACDVVGVYAPVSQIVASVQASEAIKLLLGRIDLVSRTLLSMDLWTNERRRLDLSGARRDDCVCCGQRRFEFLDGSRAGDGAAKVLCAGTGGKRPAVQIAPAGSLGAGGRLDLPALASRLASLGRFELRDGVLRGRLDEVTGGEGASIELTIFRDGRTIVTGTSDPALARSIVARSVGA